MDNKELDLVQYKLKKYRFKSMKDSKYDSKLMHYVEKNMTINNPILFGGNAKAKSKSKSRTKSKTKTKSKSKSKRKSKSKSIMVCGAMHEIQMDEKLLKKKLIELENSFIKKQDLGKKSKIYDIYDNGGLPFKVFANEDGINIYTFAYKDEYKYVDTVGNFA